MDIFLEIDQYIQTQYPQWYQTNGANFIAFIQAYYQWLESKDNALYYSRNYYNIKDIDLTFDQFIVYFKEKFFFNITLGTAADIRLLIKRALDIYRAKGTQQAVSLLFQLAYGVEPQFYYPSTDLFKLSDGNWFQAKYLELSLNENNVLLEQKEIKGLTSGATAFVDAIVRRYTNQRLQDIAYISAIGGAFQSGEGIIPTDGSISVTQAPTIKGSLIGIDIPTEGTGLNYTIGTIVPISSVSGNNASFLITNTVSESIVSLNFEDGGYGFTNTANIYLSNVNLTLANLTISNTLPLFNNAWDFLDTVTQPLASLNYQSANGQLAYGQVITTYYPNNSIMGNGYIIGLTQINSAAGQATISVISGNVGNSFYTTSNTIGASLTLANGYNNITATGNYIANDNMNEVILNTINGSFLFNETVICYNPDRQITWGQGTVTNIVTNMSTQNMTINMEKGILYSNNILTGLISMATANIVSISTSIGLINVNNTFIASNLAYCFSNLMSCNVADVFPVVGTVGVSQSPLLNYSETIQVGTDIIQPYLSLPLNSLHYGFPGAPLGNLSFLTIGQILSYANMTIGEVANLFFLGSSLTSAQEPYIVFDQPQITDRKIYDDVLAITNASGTFPVGDVISQGYTNARGMVKDSSNSTVLYLKRMRYANDFILTTNTQTQLSGLFSGFTANCTNVAFDFDSQPMGHNVQVNLGYSIGNGIVTSGVVTDSGYGFVQGETLTIGANSAVGTANVNNFGTAAGYYANIGGVLSGQKRLFDGVYYQNYSYEIISSLLLSKYQTLMNDLTHVAGTQLFGEFVFAQNSPSTINLAQQTFKTGNQYSLNTVSSVVATKMLSHVSGRGYAANFTVQAKVPSIARKITWGRLFLVLEHFNVANSS